MPPQINVTIEIFDQFLTIRFNNKTGKWVTLRLDDVQSQLINKYIKDVLKEKKNERE
jgi:hypothetical protein